MTQTPTSDKYSTDTQACSSYFFLLCCRHLVPSAPDFMRPTSRNRTSTAKRACRHLGRRQCVELVHRGLTLHSLILQTGAWLLGCLVSPNKFWASAVVVFFFKLWITLCFTKSEKLIATITGSLSHLLGFFSLPFRVFNHESQKTTGGSPPHASTAAPELA